MVAQYFAGSSWLHRTPAGFKLTGLVLLSVGLIAAGNMYVPAMGAALLVAVAIWVEVPWRYVATPMIFVTVAAASLAVFHYFFTDVATAVSVSCSLFALVLGATLVTTTTPVDAMLDVLQRLANPLSRWPLIRRTGFSGERFALAVSVMLRAIPIIVLLVQQTRQAAMARGLQRNARALIVPVVLRTVKHAHRTSEALAARGLD